MPVVKYSAQGIPIAATNINSQGKANPTGADADGTGAALAANRRRKCSINSVVPIAEAVASHSTSPSPKIGFVANFASAPPVSGSPPMPNARIAAGASTHQRRRGPVAAVTPTARKSAPLASRWCAE